CASPPRCCCSPCWPPAPGRRPGPTGWRRPTRTAASRRPRRRRRRAPCP
ncbi:MAG: hypothetical protein AVDCRST_MAG27-4608, partial [uncultured Craurococcus sp.]